MTWFFIALISPALWAIANHIDKYLLGRYFENIKAEVFMIFSTISGLVICLSILFFKPAVFSISFLDGLIITFSGAVLLLAYLPYLHALEKDETSIVAPLFQMIPIFSFFLGYFFLSENLSSSQMLSSLLIILGAVGISFEFLETRVKFKKIVFLNMALASFFFAFSSFLFKFVALKENFWATAFWEYIGFTLTALIFLINKTNRDQFFELLRIYRYKIVLFDAVNEVISLVAKLVLAFASLLAPLALVWVVNGFQPFFVFIYGIMLTVFFPKIAKESLLKKHLVQKFISIAIMFIGVYFLNS